MTPVNRRSALALTTAALALPRMASAQQLQPVSIGLSSASLVAAPPRVAQQMGLFQKHGLEPKIIILDGANASVSGVLSRSLDFALTGPGEVVATQARGQKVQFISPIYRGFGGTLVIAKAVADKLGVPPTAPVKERLKALDNVLIGTTSPTSPYTVALKGAISSAGATPKFTYVSVPAFNATLESGNIQAFIASAPIWFPPVLKGSAVPWIMGPRGDMPAENTPVLSLGLVGLQDVIEAKPDLVARVSAVFSDLSKAFDERPADVKAAVVKLFPDLEPRALNLWFESEAPAWRIKPLTLDDMKREIAFVRASGSNLPGLDAIDPATMLMRR
jgi:ABC-type nitrate/sulfonate/bicarbonate transport system substrate-binding protein